MDAHAVMPVGETSFLEIFWKMLAVLVLVLLNGFFVAAEFALVKIRDTQLDPLIAKGKSSAKIVRRIIANLDASLSACQLGITLASLALGWVGEPVFTALLAPVLDAFNIKAENVRHYVAVVVGLSALTFLHIVAGEQAPKWLAIQKPLPTSLWVARPLQWFHLASYPFIWLLNQAALWLLRRFGVSGASEHDLAHSREELRLLVSASHAQSQGTALGKDIVLNALDLSRRLARDVMRPRLEIVALDTEATISECLDVAEKTRYSRFPLCEGKDLDKTLGVIHFKDLFAMRLKARTGADLAQVARKLIYIPPTARLEKVLQLFLDRKLHMAIVVDEYGGTIGMVTLENILEELVGQIQDEFDQEKPLCLRLDENTWELMGAFPLHELSEIAGEPIEEEGIVTVSGLVTYRLGGFPKVGDLLRVGKFELRVEELDGPRVSRLKLTRLPPEPATE